MKFVEEKNIDTFGMWEDKTAEKYDKYQALFEMVLAYKAEPKQLRKFSNFRKPVEIR